MKLETLQLILALSVLSLVISILVTWQNHSTHLDHDKFILPILLSVITCHQTFSDYNLLRSVVFGSVLLFQPKGALSNGNHEPNEGHDVMQMRNDFLQRPMNTIRGGRKLVRPKSMNNNNDKGPNKLDSEETNRKSPRPQLGKKKSSLNRRKEELSNRILEEIEALDPLKCLPKALCSLSVQSADSLTDSNSHDSSQGPTEQKRKNNNVVNEYLDLMQTIITMEPKNKRQEKKRQFSLTQLERPPSSSAKNEEENEEKSEEENSEDEEEEDDADNENEEESQEEQENKVYSQRTSYNGHGSHMDKFDKDYHRERFKIQNMLATTENPDEWGNLDVLDYNLHGPEPGPMKRRRPRPGNGQKLRNGLHGQGNKHRRPEPVSYSQQYHYQSAPGPPGYHGPGYDHHEPVEDHHQSFTSILYHFMPHFIKKIIDIFIPSFLTIEYKPVVSTPPNIFSEDPFFNGFKKRNGWALNERQEDEEDRSFHDHNKMRGRGGRSMDDLMVDARERFAGAIEIGETFRNLRKCDAVYSTCPFKHTQIISMIDVLKKKLIIQDIVDRRISNLENKKQTAILKKKDEDFTIESPPPEQQQTQSSSVLTRRKSQTSSDNSHNNAYTRDSLSFSHDKNFQRRPLVIRNINKILRPGLSPTEDSSSVGSNKIQHRLNLQIPSTNSREKTANINTQASGKSELSVEYSDSRESEEDLLALANSPALQRTKKYRIKSKTKKHTSNKITDDIKNNNDDKSPFSSISTTDSPSLFQSILSFF